MPKTPLTPADIQRLNLLATHASVNAPHRARFHNFAADFEDMFPTPVGNATQRDDARSALGPSAYLVDLARLVTEHITQPDGKLALAKRRPDIFELALSKTNDDQAVPYLQIANGVMRAYLEQTLQVKPSAPEALAQSYFPFSLPFHQPLSAIRSYLGHFKIELADVYAAFGSGTSDPAWAAEMLNLAPGELAYLATPKTDPADLNDAYGVTGISSDTALGGIDKVAIFLAQTGLTQAQLETLVKVQVPHTGLRLEPLVPVVVGKQGQPGGDPQTLTLSDAPAGADYAGAQITITSGAAKGQARTIIDYDPDTLSATLDSALTLPPDSGKTFAYSITWQPIAGLDLASLDYLNRFIRLANRLGWPFDDLYWALDSIGATLVKPIADNQADLQALAKIQYLHRKYQLSIDVLCSFWADLRTSAPLDQPAATPLFNRIFSVTPFYMIGTAKAGAASAITLADGAVAASDAYLGMQIAITAGTGAGQSRIITAYDSATDVATVDTAWVTAPDNTSEYLISAPSSSQNIRTALFGALKVSDADGQAILAHEFPSGSLTIDPAMLSLSVLTRLYRLSAAARMLGMAVGDYLVLLQLIVNADAVPPDPYTYLASPEVASLADLLVVADWAGWMAATGLSALQLQYLTSGDLSDAAARVVGQALTPAAAAAAVGNYRQQILNWALKPEAFAKSGVDAALAAMIVERLTTRGLLDSNQLVATPTLTEPAISAAIANRCFVLTNKGPFSSDDHGGSWSPAANLSTRVRALAANGDTIVAGTAHHFYVSDDVGVRWRKLGQRINKQAIVQVVPVSTGLVAATKGGLFTTTDSGAHWLQAIDSSGQAISAPISSNATSGAGLVAAAADGFYIGTSAGANWTLVSKTIPPPSSTDAPQTITSVVASGALLLAATSGGLFASTDGGANWIQAIDGAKHPITRAIISIVTSGDQLVAAAADGFYIGASAGASWAWVPAPNSAAQTIKSIAAGSGRLVAATSGGLYESANNGQTWAQTTDRTGQPITRAISSIAVSNDHLIATTSAGFYLAATSARLALSASAGTPWIWIPNNVTARSTAAQLVIGGQLETALQQLLLQADKNVGAQYADYLQSIVTALQDALELQTNGTVAFWAGVFGSDSASVTAVLSHIAGSTPLASALAQRSTAAKDAASTTTTIALLLYLAKALALPTPVFQAILTHADLFGLDLSGAARSIPLSIVRQIADVNRLVQLFASQGDTTQVATLLSAPTSDAQANIAEALLRFLQPANPGDAARLAMLSGWDVAQITALASFLGATSPYTLSELVLMRGCFDLAARLGVQIELLIELYQLHDASGQADSGWQEYTHAAQAFLSVVSARYSADEWSKTFGPIRDHLNELERDALAAFLLRQLQGQFTDIRTLQDLYEFLLVDVQMSGCMETSYVREAIDCLQIYIQRCRLNLEAGVSLSGTIPDQMWDWMGSYRMWQANREIFFYPENYLDPTLRTKAASPEFELLQNALLQGDISQDTVEQAYITYFDQLDLLANLQIVNGCYATVYDPSSGDSQEALFLIGKTATEPPVYYQRQATLGMATVTGTAQSGGPDTITGWSPWQKISVNIPADEALPLYAADRLYIFWVEQKTINDRDDNGKSLPAQTLATIKFSYQQVSGNWMQAQTLVKDVDTTKLPPSYRFAPGGSGAQGTYLFLSQTTDAASKSLKVRLSGISTSWSDALGRLASSLFAAPTRVLGGITVPVTNKLSLSPVSGVTGSITQLITIGDQSFVGTSTGLFTLAYGSQGWTGSQVQGVPANVTQIVASSIGNFVGTNTNTPAPSYHLFTIANNGQGWTESSFGNVILGVTQIVVIGSLIFIGTPIGLYLSANGGGTWDQVKDPNGIIAWNIISGDNMAFMSSTMLYMAPAGFNTWIPVAGITGVVGKMFAIGSQVFVSTSTALFQIADNGLSGSQVGGVTGSVSQIATVPVNNTILIGGSGGLFISTDNGATGNKVEGVTGSVAQIVTNHINDTILVGGSEGLFISADNGATWSKEAGITESITQIAFGGNQLFIGTASGLYTTDTPAIPLIAAGGDAWLALPEPGSESAPSYVVERLTTSCVDQLRHLLVEGGIEALLTLSSQRLTETTSFASLTPAPAVAQPYPSDALDFDLGSAYGLYFREIFLHIPYLVGTALQARQQFEAAKRWYEYVFNPLAPLALKAHPADRFWGYLPFRGQTLQDLLASIEQPQQYQAYQRDPFDPFAIAELRPYAYQKALAMQYIDNLIAWGDSLYALDGWENLNAATTLYVLAAELLGPRPQANKIYRQLNGRIAPKLLEAGSDRHQPQPVLAEILKALDSKRHAVANPFFDVPAFFVIPENDEFAGYWNTVEQRLYQMRNCMNLQGIVRQLPIYEPAIDPRQLLRDLAAGHSISRTTNPTAVAVPYFRFAYLLERTRQVVSEVKQLGGDLLSALEKRDGEQLARLRNTYEGAILALTTLIKQKQQEENQHSLDGLQQNLAAAQARYSRYQGWATQYLSPGEIVGLSLTQEASPMKTAASAIKTLSAIGYAIPNIYGLADGGMNFGKVIEIGADILSVEASIVEWAGQMAMTKAQYDRRQADWQLQADMAAYEVQQISAQIDALTAHQAIVDQELVIHQLSITQNQGIDQFYRQKFSSQELYQWMVSQLGGLYAQTYQLALDLARMTERAFQYERDTDASYVNSNGWDSLKQGLLAGEGLALNLNQLEKASIEQDVRRLEIEKMIALSQLDPQALVDLKRTGSCTFALSEALFDLDFPGHYLRKIKTIALSIPAVIGPYQNIHATLIQRSNQVVLKPYLATVKFLFGEGHGQQPDSSALRSNWQANQQIAVSRGMSDAGLFELNFNDERYLPFEGTGAISSWELRMPAASNRFAFDSISDVIITLRYTALDGGDAFRRQLLDKNSGAKALQTLSGYRLFMARQLNPAGWQAMRAKPQTSPDLSINQAYFPLNLDGIAPDPTKPIAVYPWPARAVGALTCPLSLPPASSPRASWTTTKDSRGWEYAPASSDMLIGTWKLEAVPDSIDDLLIIVPFQGALNWGNEPGTAP
jgi:photosystem II stability/assembly factor-like uncharacterized protein